MTRGTGKRSYRACLRCRQRKTRCDLDGIGQPKKAPCVSCHNSGSECVLTQSRRGGNFRHYRRRSKTPPGLKPSMRVNLTGSSVSSLEPTDNASRPLGYFSGDEDSVAEQETGDVLAMDLRNPSDALQILARSGETHSSNQPLNQSSFVTNSNGTTDSPPQDIGPAVSNLANASQDHRRPATTAFDDYELVQRGLLRPGQIPELLLIYSRNYHPYCPIVPSYFLEPSHMVKVQRSEYFLLTAILTIASRDDPRQSLTHRYCWDHTQRLLVDVLLAHPWTQTPRTVEGILLLAEWLPHIQIQETTSEAPKNLFSEDRTAWSLVGLAVRHGYLQRLDRAAFRNSGSNGSQRRAEQNRLIWAYIFMADRQISVRLGQSFWSRGPSLAAKFTAKDFPSLQSRPECDGEHYASVLQATMELIQILHNAHAILYSSKDRTLAMIYEGNYSRYLDDFRNAATTWHSTWCGIAASEKIRSTLFIMYEYICLYTNAFSFQAVLTRASAQHMSSEREQQSKRPFADLFSDGIMLSPDGRYIFDAINAAINLLTLMNGLNPQRVLCYLPSRYYLYGLYAAVLLHKADCAGAFHTGNQRREITSLAHKFIAVLEEAPSTESHICHSYSRMLKQLWHKQDGRRRNPPCEHTENTSFGPLDSISTNLRPYLAQENDQGPAQNSDDFAMSQFFGPLAMEDNASASPSVERYLLWSFMPGVADLRTSPFDDNLGQQNPIVSGIQDFDWISGE